ncbi:MAG: phage portal protein [Prevotellaceae bacterium]|nr:phage portal protein [Prevotellaceae bacterium]
MGIFTRNSKQKRELGPAPAIGVNVAANGGSYEKRVVPAGDEERSLTVAAVFRAAEVRSNSFATMRLRLMKWDAKQEYLTVDMRADGRTTNYVLQVKANHLQNAFQFWKHVEMMRMFHGHCYILPRYDFDGTLSELLPCDGTYNKANDTYILTSDDFRVYGETHPSSEVIVIRGIVTRNHPEGESIIHYAARTASLSATIESLSLESAAKGGRQKLIMQQKPEGSMLGLGGLSPDEMKRQAERLQESIYDKDVIFDSSVSNITPINMNAVDLQLLDTRKFSVADIARFFGVPRNLLMDDSNSNYKTAEDSTLDFMSRTLNPLVLEIEAEFNAKMLLPEEYGRKLYKFDTHQLFALDINTLASYNRARLETGIASVNELRKEQNLPAVEGGDEHYVSCNLAPVGSAKLSGEPTTNTESDEGTEA